MTSFNVRHFGVIFMLLTSTLAAIGVGFGLWSQVLTVNSSVQTGTVIAEWSNRSGEAPFTDDDGVMDDLDWDDGNGSADSSSEGPVADRYDKDVGICTVEKELDTQGRETILNITANNGYPSFWCTTHPYAINTGSIPLKLQAINLIGVNSGGLVDQPIEETDFWCIDTDLVTDALLWGGSPCPENDFDLQVSVLGLYDCFLGFQMNPGSV